MARLSQKQRRAVYTTRHVGRAAVQVSNSLPVHALMSDNLPYTRYDTFSQPRPYFYTSPTFTFHINRVTAPLLRQAHSPQSAPIAGAEFPFCPFLALLFHPMKRKHRCWHQQFLRQHQLQRSMLTAQTQNTICLEVFLLPTAQTFFFPARNSHCRSLRSTSYHWWATTAHL